jgi:hypothetical protein
LRQLVIYDFLVFKNTSFNLSRKIPLALQVIPIEELGQWIKAKTDGKYV